MRAKSLQSCLTLRNHMDCSPPGSSVYGVLRASWTGLPCLSPGDLPDPGIKAVSPVSPALQVDSLPAEPPGKPIPVETLANYLTSLCLYFFIHKNENDNKKAHRSHEGLKYFKHSKHFKQILSHSKQNMWAFRSWKLIIHIPWCILGVIWGMWDIFFKM